jgi:AcrR family transcriptional regulator
MTQYERKIATINKIFAAAEKCIKDNGIGTIDINEICSTAGITKGAFYHHFKSKQHLLLELLNRWINNVSSQVEIPQFKNSNTEDLLIYIIEKMSPAFKQAESQLPIFLELFVKAISDKGLREYVLKSYDSFLFFFSGLIKDGIKKGLIKKDDPLRISKILFSITIGLLIQGLIDPKGEDWEKLAKTSIEMFLLNK